MCTETPFPCACQRFPIWLVLLQLRHGRRNGVAAPELAAVDGSDPPFGDASIGIAEGWHVHAHANLRRGSLPCPSVPRGKAIGEAAGAGRLRLFRWLDDDSPAPAFDHIAARTNRKLALLNKGPKTFGDQLGVPVARPLRLLAGRATRRTPARRYLRRRTCEVRSACGGGPSLEHSHQCPSRISAA